MASLVETQREQAVQLMGPISTYIIYQPMTLSQDGERLRAGKLQFVQKKRSK